jgi:hypothetical protein
MKRSQRGLGRCGCGAFALVLALLVVPVASPGAEIVPGQSREEVTAMLGAPSGTIVMGEREMLYYDRGSVELREGKVVASEIVSAEEARRRREAERAAHLAWQRADAARRARNKAEGEAEIQRLLNDAAFLLAEPEAQVAVWHDVMRRYPEAPAGAHLAQAVQRAEASRERRERDRRIAELESQVAEANRQAREAAAELERRRSMYTRTTVLMPYYDPWNRTYHGGYGYPPPRRPREARPRAPAVRGGATSSFQAWPYDFSTDLQRGTLHGGGALHTEWESNSGRTQIRVGF